MGTKAGWTTFISPLSALHARVCKSHCLSLRCPASMTTAMHFQTRGIRLITCQSAHCSHGSKCAICIVLGVMAMCTSCTVKTLCCERELETRSHRTAAVHARTAFAAQDRGDSARPGAPLGLDP